MLQCPHMTRIIYNAHVYRARTASCQALIIQNGRIAAAGSTQELLDQAPAGAEKIDARGALVLPAFHDSHLHLAWIGRRTHGIDAAGAASIDEIVSRGQELIARRNLPPAAWIQGAGANPDLFTSGEPRDPRREDLDRISAQHPVIISRHCGHTIYCNSLALKLAGLDRAAPQVAGGTVEIDAAGRPTGVLRENANFLVWNTIPPQTPAGMREFITLGMEKAVSLGISAMGSFDTDGADFDTVLRVYQAVYDEARAAGRPRPRITMQCGISGQESLLDAYLTRGALSGSALWEHPVWGTCLRMGPVKLFADGTLGGRTAWMRQPYRDKPDTRGFPVLEPETLAGLIQRAAAGGMQTAVHAIGDAGIEAVIAAFEGITAPGANPLRHGIIHCQITSPDLLERMARNRILALAQPIFLADDRHILESRVGAELAATSYAWRSMDALGVPVSYGTDAPVSDLNPLLGIEWAVRRGAPGGGGQPPGACFYPAEQVNIHAAVEAYTAGSAFSAFAEREQGRIAPGYAADLVFLDRDIFSIPPESIHLARVLRTMIAGETVFQA